MISPSLAALASASTWSAEGAPGFSHSGECGPGSLFFTDLPLHDRVAMHRREVDGLDNPALQQLVERGTAGNKGNIPRPVMPPGAQEAHAAQPTGAIGVVHVRQPSAASAARAAAARVRAVLGQRRIRRPSSAQHISETSTASRSVKQPLPSCFLIRPSHANASVRRSFSRPAGRPQFLPA
jgi:hypothetical protein